MKGPNTGWVNILQYVGPRKIHIKKTKSRRQMTEYEKRHLGKVYL